MELTTLTLELTPGLLTLGLLTLGLSGGPLPGGALSRGGDGTRGGWDSRGVGASRTSAGGRRHEAARRREAGRRGGVRRWGERVRVHATHRGWTVVRDASVRRRARDVPGVRVNPGGNTTGAAHERTKDPPPSVVDATTNEIQRDGSSPSVKSDQTHTNRRGQSARARARPGCARRHSRARTGAPTPHRTRSRRYRSCVRRPTTRRPTRRLFAASRPNASPRNETTRRAPTRRASVRNAPPPSSLILSRAPRVLFRATRSLPSSPSTARRARARCVWSSILPRRSWRPPTIPRFQAPRGAAPFAAPPPTPPEPGRERASPVPVARTLRHSRARRASRPTPPKSPRADG